MPATTLPEDNVPRKRTPLSQPTIPSFLPSPPTIAPPNEDFTINMDVEEAQTPKNDFRTPVSRRPLEGSIPSSIVTQPQQVLVGGYTVFE